MQNMKFFKEKQKIKSNLENQFEKDFLDGIIKLAKEINNNRPKKARVELKKLVRTIERNIVLVQEIETEILSIFPELKLLRKRKLEHSLRVISWLSRLVNRDYNYFVMNIVETEKPYMDAFSEANYCRHLEKICDIYYNMVDEEKEAFISTLLLHDLGSFINPLKHPEIGSLLIKYVLKHLHFSNELVKRAAGVVLGHTVPGALSLGLDNPHSLLQILESISKDDIVQEKCLRWLILLALVDIASWDPENKNNLTIATLENLVNYLDKNHLKQLDAAGEFYKYVLKMASRKNLNARVVSEDFEEVVKWVNKLVSEKEIEFFKETFNRRIKISGIYEIIYGLSTRKSFKNLVKLLRFLAQVVQLSVESSQRKAITTIASYAIPKARVKTGVEKLIECLERVPDKMSKAEVKKELEKNEWKNFFGIPIIVEDDVLLFDITKFPEKFYSFSKKSSGPVLPQGIEAYWKALPKGWEAFPSTHKAYNVILRDEEEILKIIQKLTEDTKKDGKFVVTELGCGRGRLFSKIIQIPGVDEVCGLDINREALNILEKRIENLPERNKAKIICGDFYDPGIYNQLPQSDVIVAYDVLMHLRNLDQSFKIISRKLKPSGIFIGNLSVKEKIWRNRIRQYGFLVGVLKALGEIVFLPLLLKVRSEKLEKFFGQRGLLKTSFCTQDEARALLSKYFEVISLKTDYYHFFVVKRKEIDYHAVDEIPFSTS